MKNSRAPLRTSETSYLLLGEILEGVTLAEQPAEAPKRKAARSTNKTAKKVAKKVK